MLDIDFTLDGVSAKTVGIKLCRPLSFSAAVPRVQTIQIPGRNGDLHIDEGAYNNRTGTAECFALDSTFTSGVPTANVTGNMDAVMEFLFSAGGYRKLQADDDTGHYWYARIANAGEIAARLGLLNPFTIEFDCKPYRMVVGGETPVALNTVLTNPTGFKAYPLLFVSGAGTVASGNGSITVLESGDYILDCETCRAVEGGIRQGGTIWYGGAADDKISSDSYLYLSPRAQGGLTISGLTGYIMPRWRTL